MTIPQILKAAGKFADKVYIPVATGFLAIVGIVLMVSMCLVAFNLARQYWF